MRNTIFILSLLISMSLSGQDNNPVELGKIKWFRNYSEAIQKAQEEDKAIFLLFQEVPGCATCRNYGQNVLSNGLLVDAIENEFIPLAIYNNKGGHDKEVLELYNEPSWNNPVVRILNKNGDNLINRISGDYSIQAVTHGMLTALKKQKKEIPGYLNILNEENTAKQKNLSEEYYKMYCFWSGEGHLGGQEGVLETSPGFMNGYEVVKVIYDEKKLSKKKLDSYAKEASCTPVQSSKFREDKDPQYYLKRTIYKHLPLTSMQRTKMNSALASNKDPELFLSPKQLEWLQNIKTSKKENYPLRYTRDFEKEWWLME